MAVYHRQASLIVFRSHFPGRIGTEGTHLIIKGRRIENQLRLIQIFIQELHHFIPHFHTHADIHRTGRGGNTDLGTFVLKPVGALPSYRRYDFIRQIGVTLIRDNTCRAAVFHQDFLHHCVKHHLHAFFRKRVLQAGIDLIAFFRPQMPYGTFHQLQVGINGLSADFTDFLFLIHTVNPGVGSIF